MIVYIVSLGTYVFSKFFLQQRSPLVYAELGGIFGVNSGDASVYDCIHRFSGHICLQIWLLWATIGLPWFLGSSRNMATGSLWECLHGSLLVSQYVRKRWRLGNALAPEVSIHGASLGSAGVWEFFR